VSIISGVLSSLRMARVTSSPSMPGKLKSSTTRSGRSRRNCISAARPSLATRTRKLGFST
jgi:hypothetical protein